LYRLLRDWVFKGALNGESILPVGAPPGKTKFRLRSGI
jgi:hypothetical protein